jgi:predicted naringenin-chalcone synthase
MSKIISIGTAVPKYGTEQSKILDYMVEAYSNDTASRKLRILFHQSGINKRYSAISDFNNKSPENKLFSENERIPNVETRLGVFKENAVSLAIAAIKDSLDKLRLSIAEFGITHLITVTCTGIYAPGIDSVLIDQLNLPVDIFHTSVNFMGCNAAFHALKLGDMIAKTDNGAKVLIVCVELCTLHFQPKNNHDNLLSNTIFGDGAAAVVIVSDSKAKQDQRSGITINGFYSLLLSKGSDMMGWNITPVNFEMILDAKVPDFIGDNVNEIVLKACNKFKITTDLIDNWAIHPGGKKILDRIKKQLNLDEEDLKCSYNVLDQYGNMSSPTILFVLSEILLPGLKPGENIFSIGFGPGLSIETALFTYGE